MFQSDVADLNLHGRVESICGVRIAGLGGVFRSSTWMPPAPPVFPSYTHFVEALEHSRPRRDRSRQRSPLSRQERTHRSSIYYDDYCVLTRQRADVLVTHEAPSAHPHGFAALDELARALGVKSAFHGHHHDCRDYRARWWTLGGSARTASGSAVLRHWTGKLLALAISINPVSHAAHCAGPFPSGWKTPRTGSVRFRRLLTGLWHDLRVPGARIG